MVLSVPADRHPIHPATLSSILPQPALLEGALAACDGALAKSVPLQSAPAASDCAQAQNGHLKAGSAAAWAGAQEPAAWLDRIQLQVPPHRCGADSARDVASIMNRWHGTINTLGIKLAKHLQA